MPKEAVFTMKLEPELRDAFMAAATAAHRPASQLVRDMMREFIQRQAKARDYDAYLRAKVERARASIQTDQGPPTPTLKPPSPPGAPARRDHPPPRHASASWHPPSQRPPKAEAQ